MSIKPEIDFLAEINSKYANLEDDLDHKLNILAEEEKKLHKLEDYYEKNHLELIKKPCDSLDEAKLRNMDILKSFEMVKARLRSRSTYSPIETILNKAIRNYKREYLPVKETYL